MSEAILDLRMRLFSDGGPLFKHLTDIANSSARNTRALQLMYLGLLVESGRVSLNGGEPAAATRAVQPVAQIAVPIEQRPETLNPDFAADDLAATFGLSAA